MTLALLAAAVGIGIAAGWIIRDRVQPRWCTGCGRSCRPLCLRCWLVKPEDPAEASPWSEWR